MPWAVAALWRGVGGAGALIAYCQLTHPCQMHPFGTTHAPYRPTIRMDRLTALRPAEMR